MITYPERLRNLVVCSHASAPTAHHRYRPRFGQDWALQRLQKSPRHQEWVQVKSGDHAIQAFVVYPESSRKTPVVLVIHENMGLTDWVRSLADQLAEAGYIAIAPDLISGPGPKTSEMPPEAARSAISKLTPDGVTADLNAVADYALKIPAANGKLAVAGFCWGGGNSFRFATNRPDLKAAFVFYGTGPDTPEAISRIKAPVYGFYAATMRTSTPPSRRAKNSRKRPIGPTSR